MQYLTSKEVNFLELKANQIRQSIIEMLVAAGSGHTAGPSWHGRYFYTPLL
jgi:transketolase N-terminal domain/subunit